MRGTKFTSLAIVALVVAIFNAACQDKKPPPPPKRGATVSPEASPGSSPGASPGTSPATTPGGETPESIAIELEDPSATLKFEAGNPLRILFKLKGAAGLEMSFGLIELPTGATLSREGTRLTVAWQSPVTGKHSIKVLGRDRKKCEDAESDDTKCEIKEADFGRLKKESYDVLSARVSIEVSASSTTGTGTGSGSGTGGSTGSGGTGGNNDLIQQIISALGGNASGDVQGLLSGLTNGQLQQVLNLVQGSGGNADIGQIINLVQGFTLQEGGSISPRQPR